MELTKAQKQGVEQWVNEGCGLSELQKKLSEEFGISATYMDVRFLVIDLGLEIQDKSVGPTVTDISDSSSTEPSIAGPGSPDTTPSPSPPELGAISVEIDRIMKPGSLVSGTVTFSDGVSASWWLDQFGRLALDSAQTGYTPSQQDLQAFQQELKKALEKRGF